MPSNTLNTSGSSGSRSSTGGRSPAATIAASIGASPNRVILLPVSASYSCRVSHCHTSLYSAIISAAGADICTSPSLSPPANAAAAAKPAIRAVQTNRHTSFILFLPSGNVAQP